MPTERAKGDNFYPSAPNHTLCCGLLGELRALVLMCAAGKLKTASLIHPPSRRGVPSLARKQARLLLPSENTRFDISCKPQALQDARNGSWLSAQVPAGMFRSMARILATGVRGGVPASCGILPKPSILSRFYSTERSPHPPATVYLCILNRANSTSSG